MHQPIRRILLACTVALVVASRVCAADAPAAFSPEGIAFFEKKIRPLLVESCYECHAAGAKTIKGDLMERLRRLADAGIRLHAQIVLCPGLNDGAHLEHTVREMRALHPGVATVAVVPVGLTRHRDGLYPLRSITPAEAGATLDAIHAWQADFLERLGTRERAIEHMHGLAAPEERTHEARAEEASSEESDHAGAYRVRVRAPRGEIGRPRGESNTRPSA